MGETSPVATLGSTILFVLYAMTMLFCLFRTFRLHKFSPGWKPSKGFYFSVLFQSCLRSVCFLILLLSSKRRLDITSAFLLLSIPDSMFIVNYILLLWQNLLVFTNAHTNTQVTLAVFSKLFKVNQYDKLSSYIAFCLTVWIGTQTCLYILVGNDIIHFKNVSREVGICNFSLAGSTMIGMIVLQIRYSGVPLRNIIWKTKLSRINLVAGFWTGARVLQGVIDIMDENKMTSLTYQISNSDQNTIGNTTAAMLFSALIISEIACILMVLDYAFMGIFVLAEEEVKEQKPNELLARSFNTTNSLCYLPLQLRLNMKEISVLSQIETRKPTLGKVYRASYQARSAFLRKIAFPRLSTYVLEEFSNELDCYKVDNSNIIPLIGVILDLPTISIITPYITPGSLYKILHFDKTKFSNSQKLNIIRQAASAFAHIHYTGRVHGHLTSENILINENDHVFVSDLGMNKIKKYSGIVSGYTNKSAWSSPEIIRDKRLTPTRPEKSDDVYSFAIVVWEIITEQVPFSGYCNEELYEKVVVEGYRPELPRKIDSVLAGLLINCWSENVEERPDFEEISSKLNKLAL